MSSCGSTWLASGLAPSVWQREIAQNTAWVHALRSTSSWTRAFTAPQLMLNTEPLLGQSLALLTTAIAQPAQNSPEALRPTRVKPARVQSSTKHEPFLADTNRTRSRGSKADRVAQQPIAAPTLSHMTNDIPFSTRKRKPIQQAAAVAHAKPDWLAKVDQRVDDVRLQQWANSTVGAMNYTRTVSSPSTQGNRLGANISPTSSPPPGYPRRSQIVGPW